MKNNTSKRKIIKEKSLEKKSKIYKKQEKE